MSYEGKVLTIGVSDPIHKSGIDTDMNTFCSFDVYGVSITESIVSKAQAGERIIHQVPAEIVITQFDSILDDIGVEIDGLKVGKVSSGELLKEIKKGVKEDRIDKVVLDPLLLDDNGNHLLSGYAERCLIDGLIPESYLLILNTKAASMISDIEIKDQDDMERSAKIIHDKGVELVFIRGSHPHEGGSNLLFDGDSYEYYEGYDCGEKNKEEANSTFSAAITSNLSKGLDIDRAIDIARDYVRRAITSPMQELKEGEPHLDHSIEPLEVSAFEKEAADFDSWFENNEAVFESEFKAEKRMIDEPKKAVSIGVGSGLFASKLGIEYGVELAHGMAQQAKDRGIEVIRGVAEDVPLPDEEFDTVLMSTVLSYVNNPQKAVSEAYRILKSGGSLVVSFLPKEGSYTMLYDLALMRGKHDPDRAPECPYPIEFISGSQWLSTEQVTNLMEEAGFDDLKYVQTLTKHPKFTDEEVEETVKGYKHGDYVVVRGEKL